MSVEIPPQVRDRFSEAQRRALLELRRDLHRHPELSWKEERTASRLEAALEPLGPVAMRRVARTGVVARFAGRDPAAPAIAVRGDIDALPIQEATGLDFASANAGVMHACGHDVHATWAVGAAMLLAADPPPGDVVVVLQPAEEVGEGAGAMLREGALDGVAAIFGAHVDRRFVVGQVVADAGPLAASADMFEIELIGHGAHAARPHESADPVVAVAALITGLQTIRSRRLDPAVPGVVTIGSVHAGVASNVIPDRATISGTIRALDPASRSLMHAEVRRIVDGIAAAYGVSARVDLALGTPPLVNPPLQAAIAQRAAARVLGAEGVVPFGLTNMAGEDFAVYLEQLPGCFMRVGARLDGEPKTAAHSPGFTSAEGSIFVGAAVLAECVREAQR